METKKNRYKQIRQYIYIEGLKVTKYHFTDVFTVVVLKSIKIIDEGGWNTYSKMFLI